MRKELGVGVFFIVAILILASVFEFLGGTRFFEKHYTLKTQFLNAGALVKGDPVKLSGYEIGKISNIKVGDGKILIEMSIFGDTPVKKDSIATIKLTSLLGVSYVDLSFGSPSSPRAGEGDVLASEEQADINVILTKLQSTAETLDTVIGSKGKQISSIIDGLDSIVTNVSEGKGTIGLLLSDDTLYYEAMASIKKLGHFADTLSTSKGTMGKLLNDDKLYDQATEAATNLNTILKQVNSGKGTLGKLVYDDKLYDDAQNAAKTLDKSVKTQEDLAPLQTLGSAFGIITIF